MYTLHSTLCNKLSVVNDFTKRGLKYTHFLFCRLRHENGELLPYLYLDCSSKSSFYIADEL
jgi:hypothetical protein